MIKVKAISVLEVLVLVMLTSLIVGMSFVIYVNINKSYFFARAISDQMTEVVTFKRIISYDWHQNKNAPQYEDGILILNEVTYSFSEEELLRLTENKIDTFHLSAKDISILELDPNQKTCAYLGLTLSNGNQNFRVDLHYEPDYKTLMLLEP